MMRNHADGMNKDGKIITARVTLHVGDETELVITPVLVIPDPEAKKGYRTKSLWAGGKGAVFAMGSASKTILNFYGSGRGLIGLAWFEGRLVGVGLYHSIHPSAGAGSKLRIMLATDLHSPSLQHHQGLVDSWAKGSLRKTLPDEILPPGMDVTADSIHDDLPKIVPFLPSGVTRCREKDCHRKGSHLDTSDAGMSAFESMKTEGGETERIQSYVTCSMHANSTSRLLCDCQQGFPLARTKKCSNCGPSRCQGRNGTFLCENRSADEVAKNIGVVLDDSADGNMYLSKDAYECRSCMNGRCNYPGCPKFPQARGFCIAHGGNRKKKKWGCKKSGCSRHAVTGGFCIAHGGKQKKRQCKKSGCDRCPQGGGFCVKHGGKKGGKR